MSVETEIERLNASKSAIAQAIRDKGVDVPEDAKLDTFADYVAMIGVTQGIPVTFTGNPVVATGTIANQPFEGLKIYGKSTQDGTPSPSNPVPIVSAGASGSIALSITDGVDQSQSLTLSTPDGLPGIPVASGGSFTDSMGQQRICNVVDLENETLTRNVGKGTTFAPRAADPQNSAYFIRLSSYPDGVPAATGYCICNIASKMSPSWDDKGPNAYYFTQNSDFDGVIIWPGEAIAASRESVQEVIDAGITVYYPLANPITVPLSSDEIAAYKDLRSYANTTVISTAEPVAGMEARVYCDTEKTIDRKVSEGIAAAVKLSGGNV